MARGLRSKPSHQAEDAPSEKVYDVPGLDYSQSLTWRPGKAIAVGDLLGRLQALRAQLSNFEDEQVDSRLWTGLAGDLAHANLLGHKDKGVRAWTISCIIDVLKICAPDAPFQANALKVGLLNGTVLQLELTLLGYLHCHHQYHHSSAVRPYQCLQRATCLHPTFFIRVAEYPSPGRC